MVSQCSALCLAVSTADGATWTAVKKKKKKKKRLKFSPRPTDRGSVIQFACYMVAVLALAVAAVSFLSDRR